nr:DUF3445 domain-containing protein [Candidatus Rhodobacter lobularis]
MRVDDAFADQMALRERLIAQATGAVHALLPKGRAAADELLEMALAVLRARDGFQVAEAAVTRPDGVTVALERAEPLMTLGRLVQEDFCLLDKQGSEHVLTGAILCFPASWSLAEKIGRPLVGIHEPVESYDENVATRVQRLFNALHADRPIMRANCLPYADFELFQPRPEDARRSRPIKAEAVFIRAERQCLLRLPRTGAVAFSIHTSVVHRDAMDAAERAALASHLAEHTHLLGEERGTVG